MTIVRNLSRLDHPPSDPLVSARADDADDPFRAKVTPEPTCRVVILSDPASVKAEADALDRAAARADAEKVWADLAALEAARKASADARQKFAEWTRNGYRAPISE